MARRQRVLVVGSSFHFMSGISTHTCMEANALADDFDTSVVLMRRLLPKRLYPGRDRVGSSLTTLRYRDDVDVFDGVDWFAVPSLFRALWFLVRHRPQTVVFQWWSGTVLHSFLALALVARVLGARITVEFHESLDTAEAAYPLVAKYAALVGKPFIGLVQGAYAHAEEDRAALRERFPRLQNVPFDIVPVGSYAHTVDPARRAAVVREDDSFRLLYFGTIRPYKGVENLIRAFDALPDDVAAKFTLTVVGETWENHTLPAELIAASPRRDRITFVNGYVTDDEAAGWFDRADALVLPYLRSSASGPLHMAMSHGLPVAVTAIGGLVEAAAGYTGARLVKPNDIDDLATAITELPALGTGHDDPHSWSHTVDRMRPILGL